MSNEKNFTLKGRLQSFSFAWQGLKSFLKTEHNGWIQVLVALSAVVAGMVFEISLSQWGLLALGIGMVLTAEVFNTAIELLTDLVSPEWNEKAKKVKDMSAAAVLLASITSLVIGAVIFIPKMIA